MKIVAVIIACFALLPELAVSDPLRVGIIAGLTGSDAAYGKSFQDGITLAQRANPNSKIEYFFEDDQFTPRLSISALQKLIEIHHIDVVAVGDTHTAAALIPEITRRKMPMFAWASDLEAFQNNPYVIRTWPAIDYETNLVRDQIKVEGYDHFALWLGPHDYAHVYGAALENKISERVKDREEFTTDLNDYRTPLLKLRSLNISIVGLCLNPGQNGLVAKQATELGLNLKIFGCNMLNFGDDILQFKTSKMPTWIYDTAISQHFSEIYRNFTGTSEMENSAAIFYDIALVLQKAEATAEGCLLESVLSSGQLSGANGDFSIVHSSEQQFFNYALKKITLE